MAVILVILVLSFTLANVESRDYIVYGTAGANGGKAGLYGGYFESGKTQDMELTHINQANYQRSSMVGFGVRSLSYDPVSKDLFVLASNNEQYFLAKVDLCNSTESIEEEDMYFSPQNHIQAGPFALYDSDVYYIAREHRLEDKVNIRMSLTVRKVTGCEYDENTFMDSRGHDRLECSVEVAKILDQRIAWTRNRRKPFTKFMVDYIARSSRTVGSTLLVTKRKEKLHFFVQIAKPLYTAGRIDKYSLDLYEMEEGGQAEVLRTTRVDEKWAKIDIESVGDISYKDGLLCWSTYENIFCDSWPKTSNMPVVTRVLHKGDAKSVCQVSDIHKDYQDVITGIQIIKSNPLEIAFGCWGSWMDNGGAGYLSSNLQGSVRKVTAIEGTRGKIYAGPMVAVDECS